MDRSPLFPNDRFAGARPALAAALLTIGVLAASGAKAGLDELAETASELCHAAEADHAEMARRINAEPGEERRRGPAGRPMRVERDFARHDGTRLRLVMDRPAGVLQRVMLERHHPVDEDARPDAVALLDGACALRHARRITYDASGHAEAIELLGPDLEPLGPPEPLNPPMPAGRVEEEADVIVALFDSGLAYTLPQIAERLVYGADGQALGYDFWDMNDRPFDADTSRSPFFPARHGTGVASVLLYEAPEARVVPFRYPRPDMDRMSDMVAAASGAGARIVLMPMGSNDPADWTAFAAAAEGHPQMLFVMSAGNEGRDIDERPLYPAALGLENAVVVTSAEADGRLASGVNWGARTVDLMVPGERIAVIDHRGEPAVGSGTSYAVARVAALAARLLERDPQMSVAELKAALLARAEPAAPVRHGFIADPTAD